MSGYRARFPSARSSVATARKAVVAYARRWFTGADLADIESAVGEALANSAEHGYCAGTAIEVACECDGLRLVIEVKDYGRGFQRARGAVERRPENDAPRGYGTFIMHQLMDDVAFSDRGTRVRLVKRVPSGSASAGRSSRNVG